MGTDANRYQEACASSPADLVARIVAGDRIAEENLVSRFSRGVFVILSTMGSQRAAIEDLRQETFRIALEKIRLGHVREPEKLAGFISSLARNLAIQHFRAASRSEVTMGVESAETVPDPAPGAMEQLLDQENRAIVRRVLSEVRPERYRQILHRYYVAEEEKEAICADMSLSSLHFNRVLQRARDRYRELYIEATRPPASGKTRNQ